MDAPFSVTDSMSHFSRLCGNSACKKAMISALVLFIYPQPSSLKISNIEEQSSLSTDFFDLF
jgi:hypothetical protein